MSGGHGSSGYDPGAASHRALRAIRRELERHPSVAVAMGFPSESHSRVEAELDPTQLGTDAADPTLTVRWFDGETAAALPEFSFHYSDASGLDVGWHHEPNPHVDGLGHLQERSSGDDAYEYDPYEFATVVPGRAVWEVLEQVGERSGEA